MKTLLLILAWIFPDALIIQERCVDQMQKEHEWRVEIFFTYEDCEEESLKEIIPQVRKILREETLADGSVEFMHLRIYQLSHAIDSLKIYPVTTTDS